MYNYKQKEENTINNRNVTVCFTGHRKIPPNEIDSTRRELEKTVIELINKGYRYFGAGGALGFDTIAAQTVLKLKESFPDIDLILVLPCKNQAEHWKETDQRIYEEIKSKASKVVILYDEYNNVCLFERNRHLINNSSVCVCYLNKSEGGTAYTVNYALSNKLQVINIADRISKNNKITISDSQRIENYVFERDYRTDKSFEYKKIRPEEINNLCGGGYIDTSDPTYQIPKVIIPKDAKTFERLVPKLDEFVQLNHGKIRAVIDYTLWESYIELYLEHLEIFTQMEYDLLVDMGRNTNSICVEPANPHGIRVVIFIHYFEEICTLEEAEELGLYGFEDNSDMDD